MRFFKGLPFLFGLMFLCSSLAFSTSSEEKWKTGINPKQPVSVGELIFQENIKGRIATYKGISAQWTKYSYKYLYTGFEFNHIKVKFTESAEASDDKPTEITTILSLHVNDKKQALLKVKAFSKVKPEKELIITIMDDSHRINVQELKK